MPGTTAVCFFVRTRSHTFQLPSDQYASLSMWTQDSRSTLSAMASRMCSALNATYIRCAVGCVPTPPADEQCAGRATRPLTIYSLFCG